MLASQELCCSCFISLHSPFIQYSTSLLHCLSSSSFMLACCWPLANFLLPLSALQPPLLLSLFISFSQRMLSVLPQSLSTLIQHNIVFHDGVTVFTKRGEFLWQDHFGFLNINPTLIEIQDVYYKVCLGQAFKNKVPCRDPGGTKKRFFSNACQWVPRTLRRPAARRSRRRLPGEEGITQSFHTFFRNTYIKTLKIKFSFKLFYKLSNSR